MAPVYGFVLDRIGSFHAIVITGGCCTLGCLIRGAAFNLWWAYCGAAIVGLGAANLWTVVLTYVSANMPAARRSSVVAGFAFQVLVLKLAGNVLSPQTTKPNTDAKILLCNGLYL